MFHRIRNGDMCRHSCQGNFSFSNGQSTSLKLMNLEKWHLRVTQTLISQALATLERLHSGEQQRDHDSEELENTLGDAGLASEPVSWNFPRWECAELGFLDLKRLASCFQRTQRVFMIRAKLGSVVGGAWLFPLWVGVVIPEEKWKVVWCQLCVWNTKSRNGGKRWSQVWGTVKRNWDG